MKKSYNTELMEFNASILNGTPLEIKRNYKFDYNYKYFPDFKSLNLYDENLYNSYHKLDNVVFFYSDYRIYLPKVNQMFWVNNYNGTSATEKNILNWIGQYISHINLNERINYMSLILKSSYTEIPLDSLRTWYIIPTSEIPGLPTPYYHL